MQCCNEIDSGKNYSSCTLFFLQRTEVQFVLLYLLSGSDKIK